LSGAISIFSPRGQTPFSHVYDLTGSDAIAFKVALAAKAVSAGALWIVAL
jgi:hypothetical protein